MFFELQTFLLVPVYFQSLSRLQKMFQAILLQLPVMRIFLLLLLIIIFIVIVIDVVSVVIMQIMIICFGKGEGQLAHDLEAAGLVLSEYGHMEQHWAIRNPKCIFMTVKSPHLQP